MFFFQAEDGIRDLVRSRGLGDVYKRQSLFNPKAAKWVTGRKNIFKRLEEAIPQNEKTIWMHCASLGEFEQGRPCLLYTSDAADERSSVDLGGRRIIKKKKKQQPDLRYITPRHTHT